MTKPLEDYALIGDCRTAALVAKNGSIDWLCVPRFDSPACFAALLGNLKHGYWKICPVAPVLRTIRHYQGETLILETEFETDDGRVAIIDCMPLNSEAVDVVRVVEGRAGSVTMQTELCVRLDYGSIIPWVTNDNQNWKAIAGPDMLHLRTPVRLTGRDMTTYGEFTVHAGQQVPFVLTYQASHLPAPPPLDVTAALEGTRDFWLQWSALSTYHGRHREAVQRSLITLKALSYTPTGGIVAAPTTSLPESVGGGRNWDYRFCWVRDAAVTLYALLSCGYRKEAREWREWLLRAVAGSPSQLQIMYSISGERRLPEVELGWLPGYAGSKPVRTGNSAHAQRQIDVFGELMSAMHLARSLGLENTDSWRVETALLNALESEWEQPDQGIWEVRGPRRQFTHSKVMAWVAFDRGVKAIESFGRAGPLDRWRKHREAIHREVCDLGYNPGLKSFTQYYGSNQVDASSLVFSLVGFLPASDPRIAGTVAAVQRLLIERGFVRRYRTESQVDGLGGEGEGAFLPCSFWLADNLAALGKWDEAEALFEQLLDIRNDVGLLAEEYDVTNRRLVGNFPQAFSHLALVNTAQGLQHPEESPVEHRTAPALPRS